MWKLFKTDFKYSWREFTFSAFLLMLFAAVIISANNKTLTRYTGNINIDNLRGFISGFFMVILFLQEFVYYKEKRFRLSRVLPITPKQIAVERILSVSIIIFFTLVLLLIIGLATSFVEDDIVVSKSLSLIGIGVFFLSSFLYLKDVWFAYFKKKDKTVAVIKNFIFLLFPLAIFILLFHNYFSKYNAIFGLTKEYLIPIIFLLFGSTVLGLTITSYSKRKSYLN